MTKPEGYRDQTFLAELLRKQAYLEQLAREGRKVDGVIEHVQYQQHQALKGNFVTGEGITKADGTIQID